MAMANTARTTTTQMGNGVRPTDPDIRTNQDMAQLHRDRNSKKGASRKQKYDTARGQSVLWREEDESRHQVKAHVSDTRALQASTQWVDLVGRGVTHLTLEDDDSVLKDIPPEVAQIQTLRSLTLLWSQVKVIPSHVLQMELTEIRIQECPLKSVEGIQTMDTLVSLELSNTNLKKIPLDIGRLKGLANLNLSGNSIKIIPPSIGSFQKLKLMNICGNSIAELPEEITQLTLLESLDMSQNHIRELPVDIGNLMNLVTLRLSHNQLTDVPPSFVQLINLKHLFLSNNRFKLVPRLFGKLPDLLTLNMVSNQVTDIPASMRSLTTLLLDKNSFVELPDPLFLCDKLEKLSVQYTPLEVLPSLIDRMVSLRALYLGGNKIKRLPDELCNLKELRHLVLRETEIEDLPLYFDYLKKLNILDLDHTEVRFEYKNALQKGGIRALMNEIAHQRHLLYPQVASNKKEKVNKPTSGVARQVNNRAQGGSGQHGTRKFKPKVAEPVAAQSHITHANDAMVTLTRPPPTESEQTIGRQYYNKAQRDVNT